MNNDDAPPSGPPINKGRRRPAPTIELEATEIESGSSRRTETETDVNTSQGPDQARAPSEPRRQVAWMGLASADWLRSGDPWRLVGAAVVGGLVVLAGSWLIGSSAQHAPPPDATRSLDVRLVRAEQQIRELTDRPASGSSDRAAIDALTGRIAKLEAALTAARPAANDPALANRISALEGEVKAQAEIVAILGRRHDEVATASREARQRADVNAASNAELHEKIARLGTSPIERREFDALTTRIAAIERSEKALETELAKRPPDGTNDNAVRLAVISAALWGAVERGDTYASLLTMTKALAGDPKRLAPLEPFAATGLPSAAALGRQLSGLAPALYQAAGAAPREGILDRLAASAEKLVRVRPIEDVAGTDAVAIVSRVEARAAQADLSGALAELAKLPANVREPANAWIKTAEQRSAAIEASQRMATESLAALGARDTK